MPTIRRLRGETSRTMMRKDGAALFMVLGFLGAMTILVGAFLEGVHFTLAQQRAASSELIVRNLAQAGIDSAIASLRRDAGAYEGETHVELGEGRYSVRLVREPESNIYRVNATGELEVAGRVVHSFELEARIVVQGGRLTSVAQTEEKRGLAQAQRGTSVDVPVPAFPRKLRSTRKGGVRE